MAIQHRRGSYTKFDPNKMVAGEWAIVQEQDPSGIDGEGAYMAFKPGDARRMATYEEVNKIRNETVSTVEAFTDRAETGAKTAESAAKDAQDSLSKVSIVKAEINSIGHLIFTTQNMEGFDATVTRQNGHLVLEV